MSQFGFVELELSLYGRQIIRGLDESLNNKINDKIIKLCKNGVLGSSKMKI